MTDYMDKHSKYLSLTGYSDHTGLRQFNEALFLSYLLFF